MEAPDARRRVYLVEPVRHGVLPLEELPQRSGGVGEGDFVTVHPRLDEQVQFGSFQGGAFFQRLVGFRVAYESVLEIGGGPLAVVRQRPFDLRKIIGR